MSEPSPQDQYDELAYYSLAHPDPSFIHQNIVDAFAAQQADEQSKSIKVAFALIGLYLYIEKGVSGKEVQRAHMRLARRRREWPRFELPEHRGDVEVGDVLAAPPGTERDAMIRQWCESVWDAWSPTAREQVIGLVALDV